MHELHIDSVRKTYGGEWLLTDIFICCKPGDRIGLLGRNGTGKSTLLKIIFGSVQADNKFIRVNGTIIRGISDHKRRISYLPQDGFLPSHITVEKILKLFCGDAAIQWLKDNQHIAPFLKRKVKALSGGQRRMIEILLIINAGAEYVLLDEPFNGVEPLYKAYVKQVIVDHSGEKAFIISDHDYKNVLDVSNQIMLLAGGSIQKINGEADLIRAGYVPEN